MKAKRWISIALATALMLCLAACGGTSSSSAAAPSSAAPASSGEQAVPAAITKVGFSADVLTTNFVSSMVEGMQAACDEAGIELVMMDANRDMNAQISHVENLITDGCQAIFLKPYDSSTCAAISQACADAGVPLIVVCSPISSDYDASVIVTQEDTGIIKAEYIAQALGGKGNVMMLLGDLTQEGWTQQANAAKAYWEENYPDIVVLDEQTGNNQAELSLSVAENWISAGYDFGAIWASQDTSAIAAGQACKEAGMDVYVVGQGGQADAISAMESGFLSASVYLPGAVYGKGAVDVLQKIAGGEDYDKDTALALEMVTLDNLDEYK